MGLGQLCAIKGAGLEQPLLDLLCEHEQTTIPLWAWDISIREKKRLEQALHHLQRYSSARRPIPASLVVALGVSLVVQTVKNLPANVGDWVRSLGWEDPLEKRMIAKQYLALLMRPQKFPYIPISLEGTLK